MKRRLSPAETDALIAYVRFGNIKQAAQSLGITETAIRGRLRFAREKYDASTTAQLAAKVYPEIGDRFGIEHRR